MQFKVPQNVQIEDKILPFMTLRQLVICGVGGGFTYLVYLMLEHQSPEIWIPPVVILGGLTLAVSFLKINDIPFVEYVLLILERYLNEQKRSWIKLSGDVFWLRSTEVKKVSSKKVTSKDKKKVTIQDVEKISRMLDESKN